MLSKSVPIWLLTSLFALLLILAAMNGRRERAVVPSPPVAKPVPPVIVTPIVDPVPELRRLEVAGNASSVGSDTLHNLMVLWAEAFKRRHPTVNLQIESKGSSTAPPALTQGVAQFGPMARPMKETEELAFICRWGYRPMPIRVAVDALAVYVHRDNPIQSLSLDQLDAIYSKARRRGVRRAIVTWGDLGLGGEWADKPISLYGRNSASGTYGFFKERVLMTGDFSDEVKEQPGAASVVLAVATDRYAIGYSGCGYATSSVRAVPLRTTEAWGIPPNVKDAVSGAYPLARYLLVYINRSPEKPCDPLVREFVKLIVSKEGQDIAVKDGYFSLSVEVAKEELRKVEGTMTVHDLDAAAAALFLGVDPGRLIVITDEFLRPAESELLKQARKLVEEADRLWRIDSEASIKLYQRLQSEFPAEVIQLHARNKVHGRARQSDDAEPK